MLKQPASDRKSLRGDAECAASIIEMTLAIPIFLTLALGAIDFARYLYIENILSRCAHRGLDTASWVPDLEDPDSDGSEQHDSKFDHAIAKVRDTTVDYLDKAGMSFEVDAIKNAQPLVVDYATDDAEAVFHDTTNRLAVMVANVDSTGTRANQFTNQPIGVRVSATIKSFTPFLSSITVSGIAWGYREPPARGPISGPIDCTGKPFDPRQLPTNADCGCNTELGEFVNPETGLCGCEGTSFWVFNPQSGIGKCCNVDPTSCVNPNNGLAKTFDYENCECLDTCYWGEARLDDNQCGCRFDTDQEKLDAGLKLSSNCGAHCVTDPDTNITSCSAPTCDENDCSVGGRVMFEEAICSCLCHSWYGVEIKEDGTCDCIEGYSPGEDPFRCELDCEVDPDSCPAGMIFNPHSCGCECSFSTDDSQNTEEQCFCAPGKVTTVDEGGSMLWGWMQCQEPCNDPNGYSGAGADSDNPCVCKSGYEMSAGDVCVPEGSCGQEGC